MDCSDSYMPAMAMVGWQMAYAGVALFARAALLKGMSPHVYVVYRQAIATLVVAPVAYIVRRGKPDGGGSIGLRSFSLIFLCALIGVAINQNIYFEGMYLASSTMASASGNLIPAITFAMATIMGLEKVNLRRLRHIAKILGTVLCVGGAIFMALLRGPKLLNTEFIMHKNSVSLLGGENWLLGCLFLFGSACCWSIWLILLVPVSASYPDHLSLSAWLCFLTTLQSAAIAIFLEPNPQAWILSSYLELTCCAFAGIIGSGISFFVQAWCISQRGPLFPAMFSPLGTVFVTIFATIFLHEEIFVGSVVGAIAVIVGLYVVLWGKAKDLEDTKKEMDQSDKTTTVQVLVDDSTKTTACICKKELEEPLLGDKLPK
ncbi:EamA domain [Dillenia turbinata]|uniref:WAT1-related protein n=1 Tax=Dillenia turbinata TaxID=194707 RepID=A0AAN8W6N4_9MAGN